MTKQTYKNLEDTFELGLTGILRTSQIFEKFYRKPIGYFSIIIALLVPLICKLVKIDMYLFIIEITNMMINFLPCILGFTIAGYTLIVGFIQSNMLDTISEPTKNSNYSLYQKMSGTFAVNVLIQAFALMIAFIFHIVVYMDKGKTIPFVYSVNYLKIINYLGFSFLLFWFSISSLLTMQIILNIFEFSQLHHYFIVKRKIDEQQKNENKN